MNKFRFSLQSVLQVKTRLEEIALAALAESQSSLIDAQHYLGRIFQEKRNHQSYIASSQQGNLDIASLMLNQNYLDRLNHRIEEQQKVISALEAAVEERRQTVVEAQRERKTLEILKDKQWQEYEKAARREEQHFLDEIAGNRNGRLGRDSQ